MNKVAGQLHIFNSGPDTFIWVGTEGSPSNVLDETKTKILAHPYVHPGYFEFRDQSAPILNSAAKEPVILTLPENMKAADIKWLAIFDRKFSVNFGNLIIPTDLNVSLISFDVNEVIDLKLIDKEINLMFRHEKDSNQFSI